MPRVSLFDVRNTPGIHAPGFEGKTYDWREKPGSPGNTRGIRPRGRTVDLEMALRATYLTDAHMFAYVISKDGVDLESVPRVNKTAGGDDWLEQEGYSIRFEVVFADVDNPDKAENTPETLAMYGERLAAMPHVGWYDTLHGIRVLRLLDRAVDRRTFEGVVETMLAEVAGLGIEPDWGCRDWTRLFRAPNVRRKKCGKDIDFAAQIIDTSRMLPMHVAPSAVAMRAPKRGARAGYVPPTVNFDDDVSEGFDGRIPSISARTMQRYVGQRHAIMLALAGALLQKGVRASQVPAIVYRISLGAGIDNEHAQDDRRGAQETVSKWYDRRAITGWKCLQEDAPDVAAELDRFFMSTTDMRLQATEAPQATTTSVEEASDAMTEALHDPCDGPAVIDAQCGLGKSEAMQAGAVWRAHRPHKTDGDHSRAPLRSKSAFAVATNELAIEQVERMARTKGERALRIFGVLSLKNPDGSRVCRYADAGAALAAGGQSVPWELCHGRKKTPCPHKDDCPAFGGQSGPEDASVAYGSHAMLDQLNDFAGATGTLGIDESIAAIEPLSFELADLEHAASSLGYFAPRYGAALAPALDCVIRWVKHEAAIDFYDMNFRQALRLNPHPDLEMRAAAEVGETDPVAAARLAFAPDDEEDDGRRPGVPPIAERWLVACRSAHIARIVGKASRVLLAVWRACQPHEHVSTRVVLRGPADAKRRVLVVTAANMALVRALMRVGPTVFADANAELQIPIYKRIIAKASDGEIKPDIDSRTLFPVFSFNVPENPLVKRVLVKTTTASRKAWFPRGELSVVPSLLSALRSVADVIGEHRWVTKIGIITFKTLSLAMRAAFGEDVSDQWEASGATGDLERLAGEVAPALREFPGRPVVRHYGGIRGLDFMKDFDAIATVGDPIPNIGEIEHEAAFLMLGDDPATANRRVEAYARADLEQAHGRLRTPWRRHRGLQVHVGRVLPGKWHVDTIEVRDLKAGRRKTEAAMDQAEVRRLVDVLGGDDAAARVCDMSARSVRNFKTGARAVPAEVAVTLREAVSKLTNMERNPLVEDPYQGVSFHNREQSYNSANDNNAPPPDPNDDERANTRGATVHAFPARTPRGTGTTGLLRAA